MSSEKTEQFQLEYKLGKQTFERGKYRLSVQHLETAANLVTYSSRLGGEVHIWLVTAYQAASIDQEAIALCQKLSVHPHLEIRKQAKDLLYIIQAPQLNRPREWMIEIPDLTTMSDSEPKNRYVTTTNKSQINNNQIPKTEPIDLSQVDTQDNQFVWFALLAIILTLGSLIWFS